MAYTVKFSDIDCACARSNSAANFVYRHLHKQLILLGCWRELRQ